MSSSLPTFEHPPLSEVFLAVQHAPLPRLRSAHLGEFIRSLRPGWEPLQEVSAIGQTREPVSEEAEWLVPGIEIEVGTGMRFRAASAGLDRMLQVENGWLSLNWMVGTGNPYPRYKSLRRDFDERCQDWSNYLMTAKVGELQPNLWEVGYVNLFPRGELWSATEDWPSLLPTLVHRGPESAGSLQTASGRWVFLIAPGVGRVQVFLEHVRRGGSGLEECLLLRLIARGPTSSSTEEALREGLDIGHERIVRTFADLLSDEAKKKLGYRA